jgi:DNA-binding transcriptional regulator YiaG
MTPDKTARAAEEGKQLRAQREELGIAQQTLACLIDCSVNSVRSWEAGRRNPTKMAQRRIQQELTSTGDVIERLCGVSRPPELR